MTVLTGLAIALAILYQYRKEPWALTRARVQHKTTKTFQQHCWLVKPRNVFVAWDDSHMQANLSHWRQIQSHGLRAWMIALKAAETWSEVVQGENLTEERWTMEDLQVDEGMGLVLGVD